MNIAHLKSRILDLAVRGKLTEQRPEDGSAAELLGRVREEKQRLIAEGKIKKEKPLPEITEDEKPFNIPASWEWCRLGEICDINPRNNIEKNIDISFVPMACISPGFSRNFTYEIRQWNSVKSGFTVFADNDVGIAKITPCFENRKSVLFKNLVNGFGAGTTELHILRPIHDILSDTFLFWFVKTESFIKNGIACFSGAVGQQRISRDYVANTLFPLPPLAEQKRIVEKIEQLFRQADIIEQNRLALKTRIRQTKSRVLDLAVRGKLTEQRPEDGSAAELLARVREEKQRLIATVKIKKEKPLPEITEDEKPFNIPASWEWCRYMDLFTHSSGKALKQSDTDGIKREYITTSNVYWNRFDFTEVRTMYFKDSELEKCTAKKGDLLLCNGGDVGRAAIWNYDYDICIQNHISRLRPISPQIQIKYFSYLLWYYKNNGLIAGKGIGISSLTVNEILSLTIPLPPLAEQKRIVEKIEQIFTALNRIENAIEE